MAYPQYIRPRKGKKEYDEIVLPPFLLEVGPGLAKGTGSEKEYRFETFGVRETIQKYTRERVEIELLIVHCDDGSKVPAKRVISKPGPRYIVQDVDHRIFKGHTCLQKIGGH